MGWEGSAGGLFPFFLAYQDQMLEAGETPPRKEEHKNNLHDRKGRKRLLFLNLFFYICWLRKIQIFMVNGSSRDLFKMHCAWNLYVIF